MRKVESSANKKQYSKACAQWFRVDLSSMEILSNGVMLNPKIGFEEEVDIQH